MFPEFQFNSERTTTTTETSTNGRSFLFDFTTSEFVLKDGKVQVTEGVEAVKVWIQKILKTEKFKFKIYNEYGATLLEFVNSGNPFAFICAEIQLSVEEALKQNKEIVSVTNFNFERLKRSLVISFDVETIYGTITQEVNL